MSADFLGDWQKGKDAELRVLRFLRSIGYTVEEVGQELGKWRSKETAGDYAAPDFLVTDHPVKTKVLIGKKVEVKGDARSHATGNCCLEVFSNLGTGRQGWIYSSTADYCALLSTGDGLLCLVAVPVLRERLEAAWHRSRLYSIANTQFTSVFLTVPREEVRKLSLWSGTIE